MPSSPVARRLAPACRPCRARRRAPPRRACRSRGRRSWRRCTRAARAGLELGRGARALLLRGHRGLEAGHVDLEAALAADVGGEVDREAERVVELEGGLAVEALRVLRERRLEDRHAGLERLGEALLLLLERRRSRAPARCASSG